MYDAQFDLLTHMGFSDEQIAEANAYLCGTRSLVGAPHLRHEDEAVFTADVSAQAQIALLAASQPFLTGGIAHTLHVPQQTTLEQCQKLIRAAWKSGLKSITLKREHCALYEEAMLGMDDDIAENAMPDALVFREAQTVMSGSVSALAAQLLGQFMKTRRELPLRRKGFTQKSSIGGQAIYLRTGEYDDGTLGEIVIDAPESPQQSRELLNQFSRAISIAMQYGVPLAAFVEAFAKVRHTPATETADAADEVALLLDHIFHELAATYLVDAIDVRPTRAVPRLVS